MPRAIILVALVLVFVPIAKATEPESQSTMPALAAAPGSDAQATQNPAPAPTAPPAPVAAAVPPTLPGLPDAVPADGGVPHIVDGARPDDSTTVSRSELIGGGGVYLIKPYWTTNPALKTSTVTEPAPGTTDPTLESLRLQIQADYAAMRVPRDLP